MTVTSIARLSIDQLGGPRSILVRQRREHARLDQLLARVRDTTGREQDAALGETARLVFPHASAGDRLAARVGRLGFLARELVDELPLVLVQTEA